MQSRKNYRHKPGFKAGVVNAALALSICSLTYFSFACMGRKSETTYPNLRGKELLSFSENVTLLDTAENLIDPSNFSGTIFLLEFYNKDCSSCADRMKAWRKLMSAAYLKSPVSIVMINDGASDSFQEFTANAQLKSFQLYDVNGVFTKNLHIDAFPASVLVDKDGIIRNISVGQETTDVNQFVEESRIRIDSLLGDTPNHQ